MNITFKNPKMNGWIIVNKEQLDCESALNYHIVEVLIDSNNKITSRATETFCGESLKNTVQYNPKHLFWNTPTGRNMLRNEMARLQNENEEFCGICASHLYLDSNNQ